MNTMTMIRIEHEEAKKAADKSGRDWTALIDFRSDMSELYSQIDGQDLDEEQTHALFAEYFENLVTELDWEEAKEQEDDELADFYTLDSEEPETWGPEAYNGMLIPKDEVLRLSEEWERPLSSLLRELDPVDEEADDAD